jgi:sugar lactone lactonase YvrE
MTPRITGVHPLWAVEGGRIVVSGDHFTVDPPQAVRIGGEPARIVRASPTSLTVSIPAGLEGGPTPVRLEGVPGETAYIDVGVPLASGLHIVDNPAFDRHGNLYVTFSGSREQHAPISIFVVRPDGTREPFAGGVPNPTSLAFDADGRLYVSSRFEGHVYRVGADGTVSLFASDLGVACGIAFGPDGSLYVGDRSGSILRVSAGRATLVASVPPSVAAFHLAFGPDGWLYFTGPTLSAHDPVYRVSPDGVIERFCEGFGRPQGLAFDARGRLYVVEALAGASAVFRVTLDRPGEPARMLSGGTFIGLALDPRGGLAVASTDAVYRLPVALHPLLAAG